MEDFFRAAGFGVVQGYGLTETSPVICLNAPGGEEPGSVGPPLRGIEIRLNDEGEVLVRGGNVMMGYYRDPAASAATFDNGWLRTGDLGRIDPKGNLFITGRCREVIVLSTGKNVCCPLVEHAILQSPLVQEAFVLGHGRKFVSAILVPHWEHLLAAAREAGLGGLPEHALMKHPRIAELYRRDLDALQAGFSHYERAKRFAFLPPAALADRDLVTPTLKVRRNVLESKYSTWIERIYAAEEVVVLGESESQSSSGRESEAALRMA
jgi:long-chain acyl-CoA synthetase